MHEGKHSGLPPSGKESQDYFGTFLICRQDLGTAGLSLLPEELAPANDWTLIPKRNSDRAG